MYKFVDSMKYVIILLPNVFRWRLTSKPMRNFSVRTCQDCSTISRSRMWRQICISLTGKCSDAWYHICYYGIAVLSLKHLMFSILQSNLLHKSHQIPNHQCFSSQLAVVIMQPFEARCLLRCYITGLRVLVEDALLITHEYMGRLLWD